MKVPDEVFGDDEGYCWEASVVALRKDKAQLHFDEDGKEHWFTLRQARRWRVELGAELGAEEERAPGSDLDLDVELDAVPVAVPVEAAEVEAPAEAEVEAGAEAGAEAEAEAEAEVEAGAEAGAEAEEAAPPDELHAELRKHFRHGAFLPHQERVVRQVLEAQRDVLFVAHTAAGKSLCYQLPALIAPAGMVTLVVSPLVALMQNQVELSLTRTPTPNPNANPAPNLDPNPNPTPNPTPSPTLT